MTEVRESMRRRDHRLGKLAALARGTAVVGLGMGTVGAATAGCTKSEPAAQSTTPTIGVSEPDDGDREGGSFPFPLRRLPVPNAMHPDWRLGDAGGKDGS